MQKKTPVSKGRSTTKTDSPHLRITACILARNEAHRIEDALKSLQGWTDEILVIDNESEDETVEVAKCYTNHILTAPRSPNFDAARNLAIEYATGDWIFYLDADERVPAALGPLLRRLLEEHGSEFNAVAIPFKHFFCGKWIQHSGLWPGYTRPQLLKKGTFRYNDRLHSGVQVEGSTFNFPPDDPKLAIVHLSFENMGHWLAKMNNYTDGEAQNLEADGQSHSWQAMLAHFVNDWQFYYERGRGDLDGMHGFLWAFCGGIYRFAARAKLWDLRREAGLVPPDEPVPASLREMLEFMARVSQEGAQRWLRPDFHDAILVQSACGDQTRLLDLTRARHEDYAREHQMEYLCRYGPQQTGRSPLWDKIPMLIEVLRQGKYQYVFWMDADTLLVDRQRDLRTALPPNAWLGMAQHGNPPYYNNGVMLIRNTPQALEFLEAVWKNWPVTSGWEDNEAVIQVLKRDPNRWQGVVSLGDEWNSTALQNESPHPVIRAWHGYGRTPDRYAAMLQALQEVVVREQRGAVQNGSQSSAPPAPTASATLVRLPSYSVPIHPIPSVNLTEPLGRPLRVRWEGDQMVLSSLALVNRELCLRLLETDDIMLSLPTKPHPWNTLTPKDDPRFQTLVEQMQKLSEAAPDLTVRHFYPPDWRRPATGKLVLMQPWEYGHIPRGWTAGALHQADEVWVNSRFTRDCYVRSGIPAEKVQIIPLGVRTEVFTPIGARYPLKTQKSLRFLFLGGAIFRKGADLLLEAYRRAFHAEDDVCLIVKDMGTRTFYYGSTYADAFRQAQADPTAPEIIYLDEDMSEEQLASLYRACSCVVLPYRGEGFGLSPLEGMACGLPAIVTAGGATDDYVEDATGLRVPSRRVSLDTPLPSSLDCVGEPWVLEPDLRALIDAFRWVREHPEETAERGKAGRECVLSGWTWERATEAIRSRMYHLTQSLEAKEALPAVPWQPADVKPKSKGRSSRTKIELSLCLIARDEEARIAECLQSIVPYVDEMIVVDTGSTDRTREIAWECGARVFNFPWTDSFSEARNRSLEQARGHWIFWMDADDVIPEVSARRLKELIRQHPEPNVAYQVQVRIPPGPNEFSETLVDHIKLFPNRPELRFEFHIHEQILPALRRAGMEIRFSDLYVTHRNYDRSEEGQARKRERDFRLLELDLQERPNNPFVLFNLGMTYLYANREFEVAAHYLRRSLDGSHWQDSIVRKAYALLTMARIRQQDWFAAAQANEEGRRYYPDDAEMLFQAGQIYQQIGRLGEAHNALQRLVSGREEPHYRSVDTSLRTYRGLHELASVYWKTGNRERAMEVLANISKTYPHYLPAQQDLLQMQNNIRSSGVR